MNLDDYRSANLPRGFFRKLNCLHLHIDGGPNFPSILGFLKEAKESGLPAKLTKITSSVAGPQRAELSQTYESHTPGSPRREEFEYFATIGLTDRKHAVSWVKAILPALLGTPHFVVEVERVIAVTEGDDPWSRSTQLDKQLTLKDVGYNPAPTYPIEIHHGFDIPAESGNGFSLHQVLSDVTLAGISVGGWFVFDRKGELCFRSNAFTVQSNSLAKAATQHEIIREYLHAKGVPCLVWTTVEQVLGIWNSAALGEHPSV